MKFNKEMYDASATNVYIDSLTRHILLESLEDKFTEIEEYWEAISGQKDVFSIGADYASIWIDMGAKDLSGKYLDKGYHLGMLIEKVEEVMGDRIEKPYRNSANRWDDTYSWSGWKHFPRVAIHASHGGNCKYHMVGEEVITIPKYEVTCE